MPRSLFSVARLIGLASAILLLPAASGLAGRPLAAQQAPPEDRELQRAIETAGNDRVALARNLEDYLRRFPETPRRPQVFRALVEVCMQLDDRLRAVEFAERFIALVPDDSAMMLLASELLEEQGDESSLTRAVGYLTRILDRVEKDEPAPPGSPPEFAEGRAKLLTAVYLTRARLEIARHNYDPALADLEAAQSVAPTAEARLRMAEVAELRGDYNKAIEHYMAALLMPDTIGRGVNRAAVRQRLTNAWRLRFGSDAGFEERLFAEFNRALAAPPPPERPAVNVGVTDPFAFRLRRPSGGELALAEHRGKWLVLHFWTTWCLPCREVQPLFEQVATRFRGRNDVVFLALNLDAEEKVVAEYLRSNRLRVETAYADGLDRLLQVSAVPLVLVVSPSGRVVHRRPGFIRENFLEELTSAVERHLSRP